MLATGLGDTDPRGPYDYRSEVHRVAQVDQVIRGASVVVTPRSNKRTHVSFKTSWLFNSLSAAEAFMQDHDANVPEFGDLTIITDVNGGVQTRVMHGCEVEVVSIESYMGLTVFTGYQIIGPQITKK